MNAAPSDIAAVEAIVHAAGTSFYRGMRILPPERRAAMYAIYSFCRAVDDIADDPGPLAERLPALEAWRARVAGLGRGEADDPVTRVLTAASASYGLREADFLAVIDGMAMDAEAAIVAPDLATLDLYCDRVAAAVGRLSVRAFGDASPAADAVAHALGRALQLTNILRDVAEDAARGRLYLPREFLDAAGVPADPAAALRAPGLAAACEPVARMAEGYFAAAFAAMRQCDKRAMAPARLMAAGYREILRALRRRGLGRVGVPVAVPKWRKLLLAGRFLLARGQAGRFGEPGPAALP